MSLDDDAAGGFWELIGLFEGVVSWAGVQTLSGRLDDLPRDVATSYADYLESVLENLREVRVTGAFGVPYVGDSLNAALMTIVVQGEAHVKQVLSSGRPVRTKGDMGAALDMFERLAEAATLPPLPSGEISMRFINPYLFPPFKSRYVKGIENAVAQVGKSSALRAAVTEHPEIDSLSIMVIVERGAQSMDITAGKSADILIVIDTKRGDGSYSGGMADGFTRIKAALRKLGLSVDLGTGDPSA
jgi:hypothetical protein